MRKNNKKKVWHKKNKKIDYQLLDPQAQDQYYNIRLERNPEQPPSWDANYLDIAAKYQIHHSFKSASLVVVWDIRKDSYTVEGVATPSMSPDSLPCQKSNKASSHNDVVLETTHLVLEERLMQLDPYWQMLILMEVRLYKGRIMPQSKIRAIPSGTVLRAWRPAHMPEFHITREGHEDQLREFFGDEFVKASNNDPFSKILLPRMEKVKVQPQESTTAGAIVQSVEVAEGKLKPTEAVKSED